MNIQIKDEVGLSQTDCLNLAISLITNRPPKDGKLDYGLETHGVFGIVLGIKLPYNIQVLQINHRKSNKSPIVIAIQKHTSIF